MNKQAEAMIQVKVCQKLNAWEQHWQTFVWILSLHLVNVCYLLQNSVHSKSSNTVNLKVYVITFLVIYRRCK